MALSVDPPMLRIAAGGGSSTHNLVNGGEARLAFKVKSTNNNHYRLKPVYGFVGPNSSTSFEITRLTGPPKEDKLVIQYCEAPADASDAAAHFKSCSVQGEVELPIVATE